jgi:hypothetical protein
VVNIAVLLLSIGPAVLNCLHSILNTRPYLPSEIREMFAMIQTRHRLSLSLALSALAGCVFMAGCTMPLDTRKGEAKIDPRDRIAGPVLYPVLQGTIGEVAVLTSDSRPTRVEGYGLVAELPDTGSPDMSPVLRSLMEEQLYRAGADSSREGTQNIKPSRILNSKQVAVVEVRGFIPPMATKGTTFDLSVSAVPGTQTTSIEHGILWTSELKIQGLHLNMPMTHTIAMGRGPIYCEPVLPGQTADSGLDDRKLRRGRVLNGGVTMEDMPARLELYSASYRTVAMIQAAVRSRFYSDREDYAQGEGDRVINLRIPPQYAHDPMEFVQLVSHLYLAQGVPGFVEKKAEELVAALYDPKSPKEDIALALEGLGRPIINSHLRPQYVSRNADVRYYAAWAGAMLDDVQGLAVLQQVALDNHNPHQQTAIATMGRLLRRGPNELIERTLAQLLDNANDQTRLASYNALRESHTGIVRQLRIPRKLEIDIVPSSGPPLVYASQAGFPRIALIGNSIDLAPGVLYITADNLLTINVLDHQQAQAPGGPAGPEAGQDEVQVVGMPRAAQTAARQVQLYWRGVWGNKSTTLWSDKSLIGVICHLAYIPNPADPNYKKDQPFIGLSYQRMVEVLDALCHDRSVNAEFVLGKQSVIPPSLSDLAEGARPEGFVVLPPTTQPATQPSTQPGTEPATQSGPVPSPMRNPAPSPVPTAAPAQPSAAAPAPSAALLPAVAR